MTQVNRFSGTCYRCGKFVTAGTGVFQFENTPGMRWKEGKFQRNWPMIEHAECHTRFLGTNAHYLWEPCNESS